MASRTGGFGRAALVVACAVFLVAVGGVLPAGADPGDIGYQGPHFSGTGSAPTGAKPEAKLWFNDGIWWAVMWNEIAGDNQIYRLNSTTNVWTTTGIEVDNRSGTRSDVLWDGTKLYVGSHSYANHAAETTAGARLYRFSYNATTKTYTADTGYPATINNFRTETLVIAKDSTGRIWATWNQGTQIFVNRSLTTPASWGTPFALPIADASGIDPDDISSIIAFGGNQIGVMWSDQIRQQMRFAVHRDGTTVTTWTAETPISGPGQADDHISLKADATGRVYAAVKTSVTAALGDIYLLVRSTTGTWSKTLVTASSERHTRPMVMLDATNNIVDVFATSPETGGTIYKKSAETNNIAFPAGPGTAFMRDADSPDINDATSTKQNLTSASNLVLQASNDSTGYYWHNSEALKPLPLNAALSGTPTTGGVPLTVAFTDLSSGAPTSWNWSFGDGTSSTLENPSHTYSAAGTYTVSLTVANATGSKSVTMTNYITVQPLAANFTATPTSGAAPLAVAFADTSTGDPVAWSWNFGDGTTSTLRNPSHTYSAPGTYSVTLSVTGKNGATNTKSRPGLITAMPLTADFTGTPTSGAAPLAVAFTDATVGTATSWSWNFGDGGTSTLRNPSHTYSAPGKYTVTLTATNSTGASSTKTRTDYIEALPITADFNASTTFGSVPLTVNFTDSTLGSPTTWAWSFGDGGTSTVRNPSHTYTEPGAYTVTLMVTDAGGGSSTKTKTDFITASPDAIFPATADSYVNSSSPDRNFGTTGSLRVRNGESSPPHYVSYLKFNVAGLSTNVTAAKLRLLVSDAGNDGGTVYLVNNSWTETGLTWLNAPEITGTPLGSLGAVDLGSVVEFTLPKSTFAAGNGTYSFAIKSNNPFGGAAWYSSREGATVPQLLLRVTPLPLAAAFTATPRTGGGPLTVDFTDVSDGEPTSWAWDFGDGGTSTAQNPTHVYDTVGTYPVSLTVTDAKGGSSTKTIAGYVTVEPLAASFTATPTTEAAPFDATFTDTSTGDPTAWAWDFGDGTTSTAQSPTHRYASAGTYTVSLTVTDVHGATSTSTRANYVTALPLTADFTANPAFGTTPLVVSFADATIGYPTSWSWDFGDGTSSTEQSPTHTYPVTGVYTVKLTVTDANGGTSTKTRTDYITASSDAVFTAVADAYVDSSSPAKNTGAAGSLRVRAGNLAPPHYVSYLKFNVTGVTAPVTGAKLRLNVTDPADDGGQLFVAANTTWTETGLNWTTAPGVSGAALANLGVVDLGTWIEVPIPASVFAAGNGTYSFVIQSNNPSGGAAWYSSREGVGAPQLVLR